MIGDLRRNVITEYKADTSDFKRGSADMKKSVEDVAKAEDSAGKSREKHGQSALDWLSKMGAAYLGFSKLAGDAMELGRASAERMRLEHAAGTISIDRLSEAAGGLLTRQQQLTIAAQLQHGAFKLSENQMVTVEKAMRELTREGFKQEDVLKKVTDAVIKLEDGGLKDLGIQIKATHSDSEKFVAIMDKLAGKSKLVGDGTKTAAEAFAGSSVSMTDAIDKIKDALGRLVIELAPFVTKLAEAVGWIAKLANEKGRKDARSDIVSYLEGDHGATSYHNLQWQAYANIWGADAADEKYGAKTSIGTSEEQRASAIANMAGTGYRAPAISQTIKRDGALDPSLFASYKPKRNDGWTERGDKPEGDTWAEMLKRALEIYGSNMVDAVGKAINEVAPPDLLAGLDKFQGGLTSGGSKGFTDFGGAGQDVAGSVDWAAMSSAMDHRSQAGQDQASKAYAEFRKNKQASFLEEIFGKLTEFNQYQMAFEALSGAVTASMNAWIDGGESMSKAFKHAIADSLKALASQLAIEGLKHAAYAIGSLAFGDFRGAGQHAAAAAAFGAGAIAAGGAAKSLGTTAGDANAARAAGGSAGGSHGSSGGSTGGSDDHRPIVIVTGNDQADQTPRMRQVNAQRYVELAIGRAGYGTSDR